MAYLKNIHALFSLGFLTALLCGAASPALAQLGAQTGPADPGRIGEQYREQMTVPQASPSVQIRPTELLAAPEGSDDIRLIFGGFAIEGNSVYATEELARVHRNRIGQEITLTEVYRMANDLAMKYRNDGYILTQIVIPPQTIDSGIPRIQVVEGYIDGITVQAEGRPDSETALIRAYASRISKEQRAVNIRDMERQLLLINDLPGVSARSIISPSETKPGAADILIIVERDPFDALLAVDNYGSRYLGQWNGHAVANFNSLLGLNEMITAHAVYAPGSGYELLHGGLGYEQPVGILGTRVGGLASVTDTDPGHSLRQFDVRGNSQLFSAYVSHPFIRSRNNTLLGTLSFDWRDVKSSNNVEHTRRDEIRALRAEARYDFLDSLFGPSASVVSLKVSKGLDIFGASEEGDANMTRDFADPQFLKAEIEIQRLQRILPSVNLKLTGKGQLASDALPSSEEFGVGGFYSGRGYDPSEVVGDDGISGQAELQWNNPITPDGKVAKHYQLYTFLDSGRVWNTDATTSDDKRESLTSTGLGARVDFTYDVQMGAGVAFPLTRRVESEGDRDPRFYFNLNKKF